MVQKGIHFAGEILRGAKAGQSIPLSELVPFLSISSEVTPKIRDEIAELDERSRDGLQADRSRLSSLASFETISIESFNELNPKTRYPPLGTARR